MRLILVSIALLVSAVLEVKGFQLVHRAFTSVMLIKVLSVLMAQTIEHQLFVQFSVHLSLLRVGVYKVGRKETTRIESPLG